MSRVLPNQTNITPTDAFFLRANISTLVVNNLQASNVITQGLTAGVGNISTLNANTISTNTFTSESISSQYTETNYALISTIFVLNGFISSFITNNIILDGNTLDTGGAGTGSVLLLNGLPIATGSSTLSSLQDWSFFPAVSTLQMGANNISNAGNITCQNIYNALNIQTDTLACLTSLTSPSAVFTNLRTTNLSSVNLVSSNATIPTLTATTFQTATGRFTSGISTLAISTGAINGQPFISGSNWSQYPANSVVNLAGNTLSNAANLTGSVLALNATGGNLGLTASNDINMTATDMTVTVDGGIIISDIANINLTAGNGNKGAINLTANAGFNNGVAGTIFLTANGGQVGGVGTGGTIDLTANTPIGFCNLTSKINLNASGINSYAGSIPALASAYGYNFIYGQNGVYIASGLPPGLPNVPGTTYIYGTLGIEMPSDAYMKNIYPYFDGITTPPDLNIEGRYILPNFAQVCVRMSNVRQINFQENVGTYMSNCDNIGMSSNGIITTSNITATTGTIGTLSNTNLIGTGGISGYGTIATTGLTATTLNGLPVSAYLNQSTFQTASISSLTVSSINGVQFTGGGGGGGGPTTNRFSTLFTSTLAFSTMTSVGSNTLFNYPIEIDYDTAGNLTTAGVAIAVQNHNFSVGAVVNRIEMGARANGENYIMSVWPGQNLEDLFIDATQVTIRDSDGFSTIINENPYGVTTNGIIQAPKLSTLAMTVSTINKYQYPWTSTLGSAVSTFTVSGTLATTPQLLGSVYFPVAGDYFFTQKIAYTKTIGGVAQDAHGVILMNGGTLPTFPGGDYGMSALPFINENGASTFTTAVTNINISSPTIKKQYYYDSTGNNYTASLIFDKPVLHYNPGPPV